MESKAKLKADLLALAQYLEAVALNAEITDRGIAREAWENVRAAVRLVEAIDKEEYFKFLAVK